jgi:hypothetical protein
MSEKEPDWTLVACPECGGASVFYNGDFYHCEECETIWGEPGTTLRLITPTPHARERE